MEYKNGKSRRLLLSWMAQAGISQRRDAKTYFDGHYQPRIPLLGCVDDSKISTIEKQTDIALSYGIDAFIFDWYWKKGTKYFESSVKSFMKLDTKMEFALMYSWKLPRKSFPIGLTEPADPKDDRWVEANTKDFLNIMEYCSENYFNKKNYWTVDGKPYFVMYFIEGFVYKIGQDRLSDMIREGDSYLKKKGYNGLYAVGVVSNPPTVSNQYIKDLGFDALTGYNFLADFTREGKLFQDYSSLANRRKIEWEVIHSRSKLPYIPSISAGWDATPRGERVERLTEGMVFPWAPIVLNTNPENFGKHINQGLDFIKKTGQDTIHICAWNEWSEGAYLEPDLKCGYQFLEKIREIKSQ